MSWLTTTPPEMGPDAHEIESASDLSEDLSYAMPSDVGEGGAVPAEATERPARRILAATPANEEPHTSDSALAANSTPDSPKLDWSNFPSTPPPGGAAEGKLRSSCNACTASRKKCRPSMDKGSMKCLRCVRLELDPCEFEIALKRGPKGPWKRDKQMAAVSSAALRRNSVPRSSRLRGKHEQENRLAVEADAADRESRDSTKSPVLPAASNAPPMPAAEPLVLPALNLDTWRPTGTDAFPQPARSGTWPQAPPSPLNFAAPPPHFIPRPIEPRFDGPGAWHGWGAINGHTQLRPFTHGGQHVGGVGGGHPMQVVGSTSSAAAAAADDLLRRSASLPTMLVPMPGRHMPLPDNQGGAAAAGLYPRAMLPVYPYNAHSAPAPAQPQQQQPSSPSYIAAAYGKQWSAPAAPYMPFPRPPS